MRVQAEPQSAFGDHIKAFEVYLDDAPSRSLGLRQFNPYDLVGQLVDLRCVTNVEATSRQPARLTPETAILEIVAVGPGEGSTEAAIFAYPRRTARTCPIHMGSIL